MSSGPLNRSQAFNRPKNALKAVEECARGIRKLLAARQKPLDERAWGDWDDAVRLAVTIEAIASRAVDLSAADAAASVELVELMLDELGKKVSRILAS
jgi:hypothetical protein